LTEDISWFVSYTSELHFLTDIHWGWPEWPWSPGSVQRDPPHHLLHCTLWCQHDCTSVQTAGRNTALWCNYCTVHCLHFVMSWTSSLLQYTLPHKQLHGYQ